MLFDQSGTEGIFIMKKAKLGDRVRVQYVAPVKGGTAAKKHGGRKMLDFTVGSDEVIRGISLRVVGMASGEQRRLTLKPKDAYGPVRRKLIKELPRRSVPA